MGCMRCAGPAIRATPMDLTYSSQYQAFRLEVREFLKANAHLSPARDCHDLKSAQRLAWQKLLIAEGYAARTIPREYGGFGAEPDLLASHIIAEEFSRAPVARPLVGQGISMLVPTLLELGTEEQKQRHLPSICDGTIRWCQGYSEPGAGSDLAALQTRAVVEGDHFVINGQKIWTSGAQHADWMFALVRTDPNASKHEGISFVLLDMHQDGVTVKPIQLISGSSPFCETFLDNALAKREDLVGELNRGWTIGKRLLQFERSGIGGLSGAANRKKVQKTNPMVETAKAYVGVEAGRLTDHEARDKVLKHTMTERAFQLTTKRVVQENQSGSTPGATTSIFKLVGSSLARDGAELKSELMGLKGLGWEGDGFSDHEIESTRGWLNSRAVTIYGGTNEVQMNIIAKRVLGLPD